VSDRSEMMFLLKITLGDDGMLCGGDIADALRETADRIEDEGIFEEPLLQDTVLNGSVIDTEGNVHGRWAVKSLSPEQAERQVAW